MLGTAFAVDVQLPFQIKYSCPLRPQIILIIVYYILNVSVPTPHLLSDVLPVPEDLTPEEQQELENIRRRKQELLEDIQVIWELDRKTCCNICICSTMNTRKRFVHSLHVPLHLLYSSLCKSSITQFLTVYLFLRLNYTCTSNFQLHLKPTQTPMNQSAVFLPRNVKTCYQSDHNTCD